MPGTFTNIEELLRSSFEILTRAERQIANALLDDYPVLGLSSITQVAQRAGVSAPSVVRMVQKLGFDGFSDFQDTLRAELSAKITDPIRKHEQWARHAPGSHILNRITDAVMANLRQSLDRIDAARFDQLASAMADDRRRLYLIGGRITASLADYLFKHLQVMRPEVRLLGDAPGVWPHDLLNMRAGDVVVVFDIRRYENVLLKFAELAHRKSAVLALFTDQWGSPVSRYASYRFNCHVEAPSAWDSSVAILLLVEALIAEVQALTWDRSKSRMQELESMFDRTGLFRKFN